MSTVQVLADDSVYVSKLQDCLQDIIIDHYREASGAAVLPACTPFKNTQELPYLKSGRKKALSLSPAQRQNCTKQSLHWINIPIERDVSTASLLYQSAKYEGLLTGRIPEYFQSNPPEACISLVQLVATARDLTVSLLSGADHLKQLSKRDRWAVWFIVLHADNHREIQKDYAPVFVEMAEKSMFSGRLAASLVDRIAIADDKPQPYGTLYDCLEGKVVQSIQKLEDVNAARQRIGLPSHKEWLIEQKAICHS